MNVAYINRIITTDDFIKSDSRIVLTTVYDIDDFENEALITKRAALTLIPTALPVIRLSYPLGTPLPIIIANYQDTYSQYGNDPTLEVKYKTGQLITTPTIDFGETDSPIDSISINAASDGDASGTGEKTDGDIIIIIKP